MALNKGNTTKPAAKFEDEQTGGTTVADAPAPAAAPGTVDPIAAGNKAVTKASDTSRAVVAATAYGDIFKSLQGAIQPLEFGTVPRLVGAQGVIQAKVAGKKSSLGKSIELTLLSFNDEHVVSPGKDDDEATQLVRYSLDGKTIDGTGEDVNTYLEKLRSQGYDKASVKRYVQLIGVLEASAEKSELVGEMVQVSLSPQSAKGWDGYRMQRSVKVARNIVKAEGSDKLVITADPRTFGKNDYTALVVSDKTDK